MTQQRRRLFMLSAISVTTGIVVAAACSFPEPRIVPDEGGATTDTTNPPGDTGTDSDAPIDDAGTDANPFADVKEPDVEPPVDASGEKPVVDAAGCFCDCDNDGYRAMAQDAAACDASAKVSATLFDCDDLDPRANPDAGYVRDQPTKDTRGDWNCDGVVNREVPAVNIDCANYNGLGALACDSAEGFTKDPGCGEETSYINCAFFTIGGCKTATNVTRKQGCR